MASRPHVVVIGAGFGGLRVVKGLRRAAVDVTVIDPNNFHTFQPLLYQVATAGLDAGDVSFPGARHPATLGLGPVRARRRDGDRSRAPHRDRRRSEPRSRTTTSWSPPGRSRPASASSGVDEHTYPLKTLHDAIALRTRLLSTFEHAGREVTAGRPRPDLSIVVVGGGPTGVETAGGLRELVDRVLRKDFPELASRRPADHARRGGAARARTISSQVVAAGASRR